MHEAPTEGTSFAYYVHTTYIEEDSTFPPLWACPPTDRDVIRTTNGAESFHADFNRQFYSPHPNIHVVLDVLKEVQTESTFKIASVNKGVQNKPRVEQVEYMNILLAAWEKYEADKDILTYLSTVGHRFQSVEDDD